MQQNIHLYQEKLGSFMIALTHLLAQQKLEGTNKQVAQHPNLQYSTITKSPARCHPKHDVHTINNPMEY